MNHDRRLAKLEEQFPGLSDTQALRDDPRLLLPLWPCRERPDVLAMVDFVDDRYEEFLIYGGPESTPGFNELPGLARELLRDLWMLHGTAEWFPSFIANLVDEQSVTPPWAIQAHIKERTIAHRMVRRYPDLHARFARDGDPTYTSHRTYRAENWPDRETWTRDEAGWIGTEYFRWYQARREADAVPTAAHPT